MYVIPPMDDEPPPAYVSFVSTHLGGLRAETDRLVGGDTEGGHLYMDVLADVAGHWRRLCWMSRYGRPDAADEFLRRRLLARTESWREEQVFDVDVRVMRSYDYAYRPAAASMALRKAAVLPTTARSGPMAALADAEIAWVHAYQRQQWRRVGRVAVGVVLAFGGFVQYVSWLGTPPS